MRILIAEDDDTCAMILASMLKPYGAAVVVEDGEAPDPRLHHRISE